MQCWADCLSVCPSTPASQSPSCRGTATSNRSTFRRHTCLHLLWLSVELLYLGEAQSCAIVYHTTLHPATICALDTNACDAELQRRRNNDNAQVLASLRGLLLQHGRSWLRNQASRPNR
eukprot:scpid93210/ scgid8887/ 